MASAGCQPSSVRLIAVHGTGTPLGDPIGTKAPGILLCCADIPWTVFLAHICAVTAGSVACYVGAVFARLKQSSI